MLHKKFIDSACRNRNKVAVIDLALNKEYSYHKLLIASLILRRKMESFRENYIGILLPTSVACHLTVLGTLMAGKTPVLINYATGAIQNSKYAQDKCGFNLVITSSKLLKKLNLKPLKNMVFIEDILKKISTFDKLLAAATAILPAFLIKASVAGSKPDDTSVILFTSGSEQEPKAVQLSHRNIEHQVKVLPLMVGANKEDVFCGSLPLFHVFGLTITFWIPLILGARIVTFANPLDYRFICENIKKHKISILVATPTFFYGYLRRCQQGDFDSARIGISGGDKLPEKIRLAYKEEHEVTLFEGYGTTETSPVIAGNSLKNYRPGSIGKPVDGAQVKIIDTETDQELSAGKVGKILVKGEFVMKGYLNDIEETSLHMHNGWYDTGDMGCFDDDGFLWHKGRLKRFVKIGGEMVSLVRVEEVMNRFLPDDINCCVVDLPNHVKGAEIVVAVSSNNFNKLKMSLHLKLELPAIALPKRYYIIEDMPLSGSGKIDFRQVRKICLRLKEEKLQDKEDLKTILSSLITKKSNRPN